MAPAWIRFLICSRPDLADGGGKQGFWSQTSCSSSFSVTCMRFCLPLSPFSLTPPLPTFVLPPFHAYSLAIPAPSYCVKSLRTAHDTNVSTPSLKRASSHLGTWTERRAGQVVCRDLQNG